jgi:hypothetical protein
MPPCFLNKAAISLIALVVDAAAKIVTCPVSVAGQSIIKIIRIPAKIRNDKIETLRFFLIMVVLPV